MVRNITLRADEGLIRKARKKAETEHSTLNAKFLQWLEEYTGGASEGNTYKALMERLSYARPVGQYSRDELNEREIFY